MENLEKLKKFWNNKEVLITGHDGFKGTWLTSLLVMLGQVIVFKFKKSDRRFFDSLKLKDKIIVYNDNIQNIESIRKLIKTHNPEIVFHLASQSVVSESYQNH